MADEKEVTAEDKAEDVKEEEKTEEAAETKPEETAKAPKKEKPQPEADRPMAEAPSGKPASPVGRHADFIKQIESMTVADLSELVKALEERFGVSAAAPMAVAGAASVGAAPAAEEKSSYTVMLKDGGAQKIAAIKAVREINQDLGLKEAKDLVDGAPKEIKKDMPKDEAEEAKKKLEAAGATVELV